MMLLASATTSKGSSSWVFDDDEAVKTENGISYHVRHGLENFCTETHHAQCDSLHASKTSSGKSVQLKTRSLRANARWSLQSDPHS